MRLFLTLFLFWATNGWAQPQPGDFFASGPTDKKVIALSFDDGPGPHTQKFLELLDQYKIKATFFMSGNQAERRTELTKKVSEQGHEIGDHTYEHKNYLKWLKKVGEEQVKEDLKADMQKSRSILEKNTGQTVKICRMPHGIDRPWIKKVAKEEGVILVNWTHGADWAKGSVEDLKKGYINAIRPGAILLFHDGGGRREKSLKLTEAVIKHALQNGYDVVPVGILLGI